MEKRLEDRVGANLERSNVLDGILYLPIAVPLMAVDYTMERLGLDTDIAIEVVDFLRFRCGITTYKLLQ